MLYYMKGKMEVKSDETKSVSENKKNDKSKIYFFIIAISALVLTNVYFYVKFKYSGEKLYTVTLQKEELQREIDRVEAELDNIKLSGTEFLSPDFLKKEEESRRIIGELRAQLDDINISEKKLQNAKDIIQQLKRQVIVIKDESNDLRLQNELLKQENETLTSKVDQKDSELKMLKESNLDLDQKVMMASSVKVSNIILNGVEKSRKNVYEIEVKAKKVERLQIKFTIADNPLAMVGPKEIFVRVIDPQGTLIANSSNFFNVHDGNKLQYTFKEDINFTNKGEEYEFLWSGEENFKKGAYTVLLYADGAIMGRSSVVLK